MKVTVIGYWGGFPGEGEATSGYLIEQEGYRLLVDCGSAVISNIQRFIRIEELDSVIISHYHHDHAADIGPLQYGRLISRQLGKISKPLFIYGHNEDKDAVQRLGMEPSVKGIVYREGETLNIGPFDVGICRVKHPVPCFALKISAAGRNIVYTADTSFFNALVDFAKNADLLISECSLYSNQDGQRMGHMNATDCGKLAKEAAVKELLLTHLPHYGDIQQLVRESGEVFTKKISLASMGWVWNAE